MVYGRTLVHTLSECELKKSSINVILKRVRGRNLRKKGTSVDFTITCSYNDPAWVTGLQNTPPDQRIYVQFSDTYITSLAFCSGPCFTNTNDYNTFITT